MSAFIVTYDLNRETVRPKIVQAIKDAVAKWAKLSESSYAVTTSLTAEGLYDKLTPLLDSNDQIYIITLKKPWYGFGPKRVNDWLDENLSY